MDLLKEKKWSKFGVSTNLVATMQPYLTFTFFLGLIPIREVKNLENLTTRTFKLCPIGLLNAIIILTIYIGVYSVSMHNRESFVGYFFKSKISMFGDILQTLTGLVGIVLIYFTSITQQENLIKNLHKISNICERLEELGIKLLYNRTRSFFCIAFAIVQLINLIYLIGSFFLAKSFMNNKNPSLYVIIGFLLQYTIISTCIVEFLCTTNIIKRRFGFINTFIPYISPHNSLVDIKNMSMIDVWRETQKVKDVYTSFEPLFYISLALGLTPILLDRATGTRLLKLTNIGKITLIVHMLTISVSFILTILYNETIIGYFFKSSVSRFGETIQKYIAIIGLLTAFGNCYFKKYCLMQLIYRLSKVDIRLTQLRVEVHYNNTIKFNLIAIIVMLIINITFIIGSLIILHSIGMYPSIYASFAFFAPHIFISTIVLMFLSLTLTLSNRFGILNKILKNISFKVKSAENGSTVAEKRKKLVFLKSFSLHTITTKLPNEVIKESMEIHYLLCEAANTANKYFTYQLLTIISISFLIIVFDAYYVLETCLGRAEQDENFKPVEFVTFFVCQMALYIIALLCIVEGSVKAVNKSEKTSSIIHALLNQTSDPEIRERLQNFSLQLIHQRVKFTAAGLFTIDRTLYFTITGAITTYLIILLQFSS